MNVFISLYICIDSKVYLFFSRLDFNTNCVYHAIDADTF